MSSSIKKISLGDEDGKCFIQSKMVTGHICCSGKGIHIKRFENKDVTDYDEISRIKRECV